MAGSILAAPTDIENQYTQLEILMMEELDSMFPLSPLRCIYRVPDRSFTDRLYPTQDTSMDKTFANDLKEICPALDTNATTVLDIRSPDTFDNKYYVNLMNREGLFTSDQDLYTDKRTRDIVTSFAVNQTLFFEQFVHSIIKMGQLSVLTGSKGEIRADCSLRNPDNANYLKSVVKEDVESSSEL